MYQNFFEKGLAHNWQYGFQIPASPVMEGIVNFHHDLFFFLVVVIGFVAYMLYRAITLFNTETNKTPLVVTHAPMLEIIWTIIPALVLVIIAIPSFSLLYSMDEIVEPLLTIKIIGHQWYWSYEFINPDYLFKDILKFQGLSSLSKEFFQNANNPVITYDSYMIASENAPSRAQRLLEVDNKLYLPIETNVRLLITSADVLHSWAVPSLGIKMDACPGRLNQTSVFIKRPGVFYGQCSEICGVNHGFMPIVVLGLDLLGDGSSLDSVRSEAITALFFFFLKKKYA